LPVSPATYDPTLPSPTPEQRSGFARRANAFAIDLFGKLRREKGNLAFSPASISMALAMAYGGARNETAAEMARVMRFDGDIHEGASRILSEWNDPERESYELHVANRLFGEQSYAFEEAFLTLTRDLYAAPLESMNFKGAPDKSRGHINAWVAKQTRGRIRNILPPGSVQNDTRLVLTNAVYFLGRWVRAFSSDDTQPRPFYLQAGSAIEVPTMMQESNFDYTEDDAVQVLEMRYQGGDFAMTVVLPKSRYGLDDLEQSLSLARIDDWIGSLGYEEVTVMLPKFEIDPPNPINLSKCLETLGMRRAFDRGHADFTGMANPPDFEDRLFISKVCHKAFVKVDEKGSEAAAVTVVFPSAAMGLVPVIERVKIFRADHPFLFLIRDLRSHSILFMGRFAGPASVSNRTAQKLK
jgi:serpin B